MLHGVATAKKLAPHWEESAGILAKNDPPIKLAKVDCTEQAALCTRFGVSGYPTIKVFRKGVVGEYKGTRETPGIVSYMKKNAGEGYKILNSIEAAKKFFSHVGDVGIVGYFAEKSPEAEKFIETATALRDEFRFAYINDKSVAEALGLSSGVTMLRGEKDKIVHSLGDLKDWIYDTAVEIPGEITKDNIQRWTRKNLPIVKLYTDVNWGSNLKQTNYYLNRLKKLAEEFKGKVLFALAHSDDHKDEIAKFGLTDNGAAVGIDDHVNSQRFKHTGEFSVASVSEFVKDFLAGKLQSFIKSEPRPEQGPPGSVTIVTGETFKEIVMDPKKDVLFEMYAPWCGHCKTLAPIYDELASSLKDVDTITIAKMDATANDSPHSKYQAKGYPTLFFAPAGDKENPIPYNGGRDLKSFTDFLKTNAKTWNHAAKSEL